MPDGDPLELRRFTVAVIEIFCPGVTVVGLALRVVVVLACKTNATVEEVEGKLFVSPP